MKLHNASAEELLAYIRRTPDHFLNIDSGVVRKAPSSRVHNEKVRIVKGQRELSSNITPNIESSEVFTAAISSDSSSISSQSVSEVESSRSFSDDHSQPVITAEELWRYWVSKSESLVVDPKYIISFMPKEHLSPSMLKRYNDNPKYAIKLNYGDKSCIGMMPIGGHSGNIQSAEYDRFARMLHFEWLAQGRPAADEAGKCSYFYDSK